VIPKGQRNILLLSLCLVALFLFLGYQSYRKTEKAALEEFNQRQLVLARETASGIELYLESLARDLRVLGRNHAVQRLDEEKTRQAMGNLFSELKTLGVNDIGLLTADGLLKYNVTAPQLEGADFSWRKYYQDIRSTSFNSKYASEFIEFKGADAGLRGVLIAVPVYDDADTVHPAARPAGIAGVLICTMKLDVLISKFVAPVTSSKRGHTYLLDDRRHVLWAPDSALFGKDLLREARGHPAFQSVVERMSTGASGQSEYSFRRFDESSGRYLQEEEEVLIAYSPIHAGNALWSVGVWAPKEGPRLLLQAAYRRQMLLVALAVLSVIGGTSYAIVQSTRGNRQLRRDITERTKIEDALRRSKEFFETTLDSMNDAVSIINVKDFSIAGVNRVFLEQYGLKEEEVIGKSCYGVTHRRLDPCGPPDDVCPLTETLRKGEHAVAEHVHYQSNGEKVFVEVSTSPIRNEDGNIAQVVHVARDITRRKQAEEDLRKYAGELEEANRLKVLFTDIIGHDLLNPASVIRRCSEILDSGEEEDAAELRSAIQRNARKIEEMVKSISKYARVESVEEIEKTDQDLVGVLAPIIERFEPDAADKSMTIEFDPKGKAVLTASPLIEDVFSNILSNAIKYSPRNTTVLVNIMEGREDWVVSFADEGEGIPDAFKKAIFDRFERHEKKGVKGTGLGLAIAKRIVDLHAGSIWVEDNSVGGCTFRVRLPKHSEQPEGSVAGA
jgi:PAS domain S-box-containing protein